MNPSLGHLQIEEIRLPPGREWSGAGGAWRFARVQGGVAYWLGGDCTRSLAAGEMLVAGPKIPGSIRASQINEVVLHVFNFLPDLLGGFFTLSERHFFDTDAAGNCSGAIFLPPTHPATRQFAALLSAPETPAALTRRAELLSLVLSIFNGDLARLHPPVTRTLSARHRFQQLISKMPDAGLVNHTPEHLAQLCGCSLRHFSRLFHQQFGSSVRARQTELRLLKARQLLRNPGLPVAQAAADSGYRHLSRFNALFKRKFGMTPTEWRQRQEEPVSC